MIPNELDGIVKLCYFAPEEGGHQKEIKENHIIFDDMQALKLYCLTHPFAINMPSLIDEKCKVCYGTGRIGRDVETGEIVPCQRCLAKNYRKKIKELIKLRKYDRNQTRRNT